MALKITGRGEGDVEGDAEGDADEIGESASDMRISEGLMRIDKH
jgi:hypothetical protein